MALVYIVSENKIKLFIECLLTYLIEREWICRVFNTVFNSILVISRRSVHLSCFPVVLLTSTPHNILSKPLTAFLDNHCRNNGQRLERNESCHNGYPQSSKRILAEPGIEPVTSCSMVRKAAD